MAKGAASGTHPLSWVFVAASAVAAIVAATLLPDVASGETIRLGVPWIPSLGIELAFFIDGLSLLFALLIAGIGILVGLYAGAYMRGYALTGRFFFYLLAFELSMLGLVLADDIITLFVFWELTTLSSYALIGFDHTSEESRRKAWQALLVTGAGGLALLPGLLLLAAAGGSMSLSELIEAGGAIKAHPSYGFIFVLVVIGAFTKSAQFPFHFWLPNAMAAPTPVSAYLHSATMVKGGVYLLARLHPALGGTAEWMWTLTIFGAVTAVWGALVALRQTDLKLALAYTTVSALGTLTMFLGSEARIAIAAAITFLIVHALYKCALFMVVGIIDHETGTRDAERLRGLARAMPITSAAAAAAAFSMAGFPPFLGFIGKELKYEGALAVASEPILVAGAAMITNALMVAVAGIVALRPFVGGAAPLPRAPREPPLRMWVGPAILAALGLAFGLVPPFAGNSLVQPAVVAILGSPETVKLALWHGINVPLGISILTFAFGVVLYSCHPGIRRWLDAALARLPVTGDSGYDLVKGSILRVADEQTRILQNGRLRSYLFVVFAAAVLTAGLSMLGLGRELSAVAWPDAPFYEWAIVLLIAGGALLPAVTTFRLAAICGLGTVGAGIALIFLSYGAPDVAMTQLLVEILFVVMIAVILLKLPRLPGGPAASRTGQIRDIALAAASGIVMSVLIFAVLDQPLSRHVTQFYEANSLPAAHGRNIVNVILVDFRALDTLGEIIVVAVAAMGAFALIKIRARREVEK